MRRPVNNGSRRRSNLTSVRGRGTLMRNVEGNARRNSPAGSVDGGLVEERYMNEGSY